ncbi:MULTISPECIES: hypothetical protein [Pseudanabaena]|jgi:hypothetical protein|uniref:hypothetical protein n=1 Tax=Pseudanabaena TaxID=1152 RepID=UPI002478A7F5|nr:MULTISPECIES: hypothetical protein [Pseudanabaena]MEA5487478.1 hypothetical protein [Pseudanabaena sp. CCNP1317]WGS74045.1 hypothetical protein OA858_08465 [Pseudanabaena galeata CCNP1313]
MELKSARPKSRLRYLRLLFFIPAIAALLTMAYCIWQIFPWFVAMAIAGPIAGYSISQIIPLFFK